MSFSEFNFFHASLQVWRATEYALRNAELSGRGRLVALENGGHEYFDFTLLDPRVRP